MRESEREMEEWRNGGRGKESERKRKRERGRVMREVLHKLDPKSCHSQLGAFASHRLQTTFLGKVNFLVYTFFSSIM